MPALLVAVLVLAGCGGEDGGPQSDEELVIGASLPLTGPFSESGEATEQGYRLWEEWVNEDGGLLGRPVRMEIVDDGSEQNTVTANYNALIDRDNVDLLLGTYSGLLNEPAAAIAEQREMLFVCPACGAPSLLDSDYEYFFFAQPAVAVDQGVLFAEWVAGLPDGERPTQAAYISQDNPFTSPVVEGVRERLEAVGVQTVYNDAPYPEDLDNFGPIATAIAESGADMIVHGSQGEDGISLIRSLMQIDYQPRTVFQTVAPSLGAQYADAIGEANTEGIMYAASWSEDATFPQNDEFVERYQAKYGEDVPEDAASAFGVAQVLQAAVEEVGSVEDQTALADFLHSNEVDTIQGPISWDERGAPQGEFLLAQWQEAADGFRPMIALPRDVANTDEIVNPKPEWAQGAQGT
jgi:branched-chain amino acid transport system substrate-binding protein